jgi:hypothetical protein
VLRHTCATWLMQRGVPMWEAAGFLGISRETPERVYGHYPPEYLRTATEALGSLSAECPRYPILFLQHFGGKCCKESPKNGAYREALFFSEGKGHKFESCRARHVVLICEHPAGPFWLAMTAFSIRSLLPLTRTHLSSTSMAVMSDCK